VCEREFADGPPRSPNFNPLLTLTNGGQMIDLIYEYKIDKYVTLLNVIYRYNNYVFRSRNSLILSTYSSLDNRIHLDVSFSILNDLKRKFL
jgi:hypothetical protein